MSGLLLSVQGVTKSFRDAVAVDALSFDVRAGEIFGFLGPNGAGKTTTLRMILGITKPDRGVVQFDGAPGIDRTRVGYLPEERGLYDDQRVLDTLVYLGTLRRMSPAAARAAGMRWLERFGLADRAKAKLTGNAESAWAMGLSWVPLFSPTLMPARMALGAVAPWEHALALVLLACATWLMRLAAGHALRIGMLMYGKELNLPELVRWARSDSA